MSLADVFSKLEPSKSLGSLVVGDSILIKATSATSSSPTADTDDKAFLCVTESFPHFRSWIHGGKEADFVRALLATLRSEFMLQSPAIQLGYAVATLDAMVDDVPRNANNSTASTGQERDLQATAQVALAKAVLLLDCNELPHVNGTMRLFSGGFVFLSPHLNPILVSFAKHVRSFQVVASQFEELVLLRIDLKADDHTGATPVRSYQDGWLWFVDSGIAVRVSSLY